ncbi:hypothetical protein [Streptomyces sp. NPDC051546]
MPPVQTVLTTVLTGKFGVATESVLPDATPESLEQDSLALSKQTEQDAL